MKEYRIDPELNEVLPKLSDADYKALEQSLLTEGFKGAPIMIWGDIIVDGHNRYEICNKHNIPYEVKMVEFGSKEEAIIWMVRQQLGRRSLTPLQRIQIVEKYRPFYKKKAKENQSKAGKNYGIGSQKLLENSTTAIVESENSTAPIPKEEKVNVRAELAKDADVSTNTYSKGMKILESGNEELIKETINGQKSINKAFNELKKNADANKSDNNFDHDDQISDAESMLTRIQKRYHDYLLAFQQDIKWLSDKDFYRDEEEISGKIHSDLQNCLEKFKSISDVMEKMIIDEFGCITIKK